MKRKKARVKAEPKPLKDAGFYLIWNPRSEQPPRVRYPSEEEGDRVAGLMVAQHNEEFILLQAVRSYRPGPPKVVSISKAPRRILRPKPAPPIPKSSDRTAASDWRTYGDWRKAGWQVRGGQKGQRFPDEIRGWGYVTKFHSGQVDRRELLTSG